MKLKEKTREKPQKAGKQSQRKPVPGKKKTAAPAPAASAARRPAPEQRRQMQERPSAPADADEEIFIPDAASQRTRHAEQDAGGTATGRQAKTPRKAASRSSGGKRPAAGRTDAQYQPYRNANQQEKARKRQEFRSDVSKFFSWQNPVARLFYKEDPNVFGVDAREAKKEKRRQEEARRRARAKRMNTPEPVYTTPVAFNSRRLAIQLTTILCIVVALVLGMSVFFKVKNITVTGAKVYDAWTIRQESGIMEGDNLLTFGRTRASGQIIANLPYVRSARIGIKLPDTVNIEIEEEAVVYAIQDQDGVWWLINSDGKVVEQTSALSARSYTQVLGVTLNTPQPTEMGVAYEETPTVTDGEGEAMPVLVTGTQRLNAALKILQSLELSDIVGDAASVNVSTLQDIILWYGTQYQVNLGTIDRIDYKIAYMKSAILQMNDYQTGILDISFTTWPDQAGFTPFA